MLKERLKLIFISEWNEEPRFYEKNHIFFEWFICLIANEIDIFEYRICWKCQNSFIRKFIMKNRNCDPSCRRSHEYKMSQKKPEHLEFGAMISLREKTNLYQLF